MKTTIEFSREIVPDDFYIPDDGFGEWYFIGIRARAIVTIANDIGTTATTYTVTSAGLWGIESDSGEDYFNEVYEEQKNELLEDLEKFSLAVANYKEVA